MGLKIANDRKAVFAYLEGCDSYLKVSIGAVEKGIVNKNVIIVREACPRVVREIVRSFDLVSVTEDGLRIPLDS